MSFSIYPNIREQYNSPKSDSIIINSIVGWQNWFDNLNYFANTADAVADELGGLTEAEFDERLHDM
eukprot:COSAG02_NODE_30530_length_549_cov_0.993333_1_plen_65_part_10